MAGERPSIHEAMAAVMADVGAVGKGGWNEQQKYAFRGIDQFMTAVHPAMVKHGVFVCPEVLSNDAEVRPTKSGGLTTHRVITVRYTFFGPAGDSVSCVTVGESADSYDKASNKCLAAAYKYALMQVFCIPLESEKDGDSASPDMGTLDAPPRDEHLAEFNRLCDVLGLDTRKDRAGFVAATLGREEKWSKLDKADRVRVVAALKAVEDGEWELRFDNAGRPFAAPHGEPFEIEAGSEPRQEGMPQEAGELGAEQPDTSPGDDPGVTAAEDSASPSHDGPPRPRRRAS